ncbi:MAG: hypothetical protein JOZ58_00910, partial [Acetobacteraceae bacterium]|nr:hypothetical protein [Acetobacteraceae bacterium]
MTYLLVIDGNSTSDLEWVRRAFPTPSHRVDMARTGTEGLELARSRQPD